MVKYNDINLNGKAVANQPISVETIKKVLHQDDVQSLGINYYETSVADGLHYVVDYRTDVLIAVDGLFCRKKVAEMKKQKRRVKCKKVDGKTFVVIYRQFVAQENIFTRSYKRIQQVLDASDAIEKLYGMKDVKCFMLDVVRLIIDLSEGVMTVRRFASILISIYNLFVRFSGLKAVFHAQFFTLNDISFDSLFLMFSVIGLPANISSIFKEFNVLTGRKLLNSNVVISVVANLYKCLSAFFPWLMEQIPCCAPFANVCVNIIDYLFSNVANYSKIRAVVEKYSNYVRDPKVILDPEFRRECSDLLRECIESPIFMEYIDNVDNKHFRGSWLSFRDNLMKFVTHFDESRRDEPICIIFEGAPGQGKSVLMNGFVDVLRGTGKSIYVHSVPPSDDGKDFYDDYENQDVFVVDDMGQMGKSQWKSLINFVSPVKYPLACANANKKNTKFFNSSLILITTNCFMNLAGFTSKDCIAEPEALFRRANVIKVTREEAVYHLEYNKYDYVEAKQWVQAFLGPQVDERAAPAVVLEGDKLRSLAYILSVYRYLREQNIRIGRDMVVSEDDILTVLHDAEEFYPFNGRAPPPGPRMRAQDFNFGTYLRGLLGDWVSLDRGAEVFTEWLHSFMSGIDSFIVMSTDVVSTLWRGDNSDADVRKLFLAKQWSQVLDKRSAIDNVAEYRRLALKFHPDKYVAGDSKFPFDSIELRVVLTSVLNSAKECYEWARGNRGQDWRDRQPPVFQAVTDDDFLTQMPSYTLKRKIRKSFLRIVTAVVNYFLHDPVGSMISWVLLALCGFIMGKLLSKALKVAGHLGERVLKFASKHKQDPIFQEPAFSPQGLVNDTITKHCKYITGVRPDGERFETHAVVSGQRLLMNSHGNYDRSIIDVYSSYEHYRNKHRELDKVEIKIIEDFPSCDIAVFEFVKIIPLYSLCKAIFRDGAVQTPLMTLINSIEAIPLVVGTHVFINTETVKYSAYSRDFEHRPPSGLLTPVEGNGLCGSFICNNRGDIVAIHAAGDGKHGFCVTPSLKCMEHIRRLMLDTPSARFDIDVTIRENFSGVRLRYNEGDIKPSFISGKPMMVKSVLHRDHCEATYRLIEEVQNDALNEYTSVPDRSVDKRRPPNFTGRPSDKLKEMSAKTFKCQAPVTGDEVTFIQQCIRAIMPEKFGDISDNECAFGGPICVSIAKDTSNGYGHPAKSDYFDFENRIIKEEFVKELADFKKRVDNDEYEYKDFMCKEVFKADELRNEEKADKPRTIRVMPITQIWYTKKIFAQLMHHFKKNMHKFGLCIGLNPYKDFDTIYHKLVNSPVKGDVDFGGWDGSLNSTIMLAIFDVIFERYDGDFDRKMFYYIATTIVRSFVLVSDELYATTHGMPSGTWLTLLLNCLVNKAIVALTLYRHSEKPSVGDFLKVISYVMGDDNVFGVSGKLGDVFNLKTLSQTAEELGMTCTNGDKTPITKATQEIQHMTFLKRHFRFHPVLRRYVGCLSLSTILNTFQYVNRETDVNDAMQGKINSSLVEAFLHSPSLYRRLASFYREQFGSMYRIFDEERVVQILEDDEGYAETCAGAGKFFI